MKDAKGHGSAAHQSGIRRALEIAKRFAKDTGGTGRLSETALHLGMTETANSVLPHLAHFLGSMGAFAIVGAIGKWLMGT